MTTRMSLASVIRLLPRRTDLFCRLLGLHKVDESRSLLQWGVADAQASQASGLRDEGRRPDPRPDQDIQWLIRLLICSVVRTEPKGAGVAGLPVGSHAVTVTAVSPIPKSVSVSCGSKRPFSESQSSTAVGLIVHHGTGWRSVLKIWSPGQETGPVVSEGLLIVLRNGEFGAAGRRGACAGRART
jgi:hypothetical protein